MWPQESRSHGLQILWHLHQARARLTEWKKEVRTRHSFDFLPSDYDFHNCANSAGVLFFSEGHLLKNNLYPRCALQVREHGPMSSLWAFKHFCTWRANTHLGNIFMLIPMKSRTSFPWGMQPKPLFQSERKEEGRLVSWHDNILFMKSLPRATYKPSGS